MQEMPSHVENLERVVVKIAPTVHAFCAEIWRQGRPRFHMMELTAYVRRCIGEIAPDSAGRILRELRLRGRLDYAIVSRRDSLYELRSVA
jgi:hypothetical protein